MRSHTQAETPSDERELYLADLNKDRHFARLSGEAQAAHLDTTLAYAREAAQAAATRFGRPEKSADVFAVADALAVKVAIKTGKSMMPYLAEYSQRPTRIRLYQQKIDEMEKMLRPALPGMFDIFGLKEMSLCHELFHHWERLDRGDTGRLIGLPTVRFKWFPTTHYVAAASEAASHEFVKTLLRLDRSPVVFQSLLSTPPQ